MATSAGKVRTPEQLVLEFLGRVWGPTHELNAIDELMTANYVITSGGKTIQGRDAFKEWVKNFQQVLAEAITISQDIFSNAPGDMVVSRWICSGKNNGMFGLDPDSKPVSFTGIAIWKIRENQLAECWVERSAYELYQQLQKSNS
jgi:predicted ester cyclase